MFDHAEAAELALEPVVVAVVVSVPGDEPGPVEPVDGLHLFGHLDGERQPGHPRPPGSLVGEVELRGRGIADPGPRTEVVVDLGEQVGLPGRHQVEVTQLPAAVSRQR